MFDSDDDPPRPLPRDPGLLREALLDVVTDVAADDIVSERTPTIVTHETRVKCAQLRHKLFGEETGETPFDPDHEREAQAQKEALRRKHDQSLLAAILSRGIGEA